MKTITIRSQSFVVREDLAALLQSKVKDGDEWPTIQDMLVWLFTVQAEVHTDEYALAIAVWFPESTAVREANRRTRATADARKFSKGELRGQEGAPVLPARILDAGSRGAASADMEHAKQVADLLS